MVLFYPAAFWISWSPGSALIKMEIWCYALKVATSEELLQLYVILN